MGISSLKLLRKLTNISNSTFFTSAKIGGSPRTCCSRQHWRHVRGWTNEHLNCQKLVGLVDALGLEPEIATSTLTFHCSSSKLILWALNLSLLPSKPFKSTCVVTQQSNLTARQRWCKLGLLVQFVDLVRSGCGAAFDQLFALLAPSSYSDDDSCKDCLCGKPHGKNLITTSLYSSYKTSLKYHEH